MKSFSNTGPIVALVIAFLCVADVSATHYEVIRLQVEEANGLMLPMIACGWIGVWVLKIGLALLVALTGTAVWRTLSGKFLMLTALAGNLFVNCCHLAICGYRLSTTVS